MIEKRFYLVPFDPNHLAAQKFRSKSQYYKATFVLCREPNLK